MQVSFERTGGFAGLRLSIAVDSQSLEQEELEQLQDEVIRADFFHLPDMIDEPASADRFEYRISVEWGEQRHSITVAETAMPDDLRPLVNRLERMLRTHRRTRFA